MADWTTLDPNSFLQGRPITSAQGQALEENLRATAEGAPGAPRVAAKALQGGNYIGRLSASGTSPIGFFDLDDIDELDFFAAINRTTGGNQQGQLRFSSDNGSSYGAWQDFIIAPGATNGSSSFSGRLSLVDGRCAGIQIYPESTATLIGSNAVTFSFTLPSGTVNAFQYRGGSGANHSMAAYAATGKTL